MLKGTVRRPDNDLLHNQGSFPEYVRETGKDWGDEQLRAAMLNPLGSCFIHMNARPATPAGREAGPLSRIEQIEPEDLRSREETEGRRGEIEVILGESTVGHGAVRAGGIAVDRSARGVGTRANLGHLVQVDLEAGGRHTLDPGLGARNGDGIVQDAGHAGGASLLTGWIARRSELVIEVGKSPCHNLLGAVYGRPLATGQPAGMGQP